MPDPRRARWGRLHLIAFAALALAACDATQPIDPEPIDATPDAAPLDAAPALDGSRDPDAAPDAAPDPDAALDAEPPDAAPDAEPADATLDAGPADAEVPDAEVPDAAPPPPDTMRLNELDCRGREFIELVNIGPEPVDLAGWRVSDDPEDPADGLLLDGPVVAPGEIIDLRRQTADEDGFTFGIACGDDRIVLRAPDGREIDAASMPELPEAYTWGRLPDGVGRFSRTLPTRGEPNRAPELPSGELYDPMRVFALDFEVTPEALDQLGAAPRELVPATMRYEGGDPMPVGLRLKGRAGSFRTLDRKSAFKVRIDWEDEDAELLGQRRLTLNNMVQDRSMLHEWLSYTLFRAMGVAAPRVGYARVSINGEPYGLYANIEEYENELLERWFTGTENLYEGAYGTDLFPDHVGRFDSDEGDDDPAELEALIALLHAVEPAGFFEASQDVIDWPQVLAMMVTEIYIGHWDGYAPTRNNYYLHFDDHDVLRLLPWGTDQTFDRHLAFRDGQGLLLQRCRAAPACLALFDETLVRLVGVLDALALIPQIEAQALFLREHAEADPRKPYDINGVDDAVRRTIAFLERRRGDVDGLVACLLAEDRDPDGDGFICDQDCDPEDGLRYPGAPEICGDGIDQDCNGYADDSPECPDCEELLRDGHRYLVCTTPRPYVDAIARCREHGAEGWIPDSAAEADWVFPRALQIRNQDYWLGFDDRATEGTFVWPDGIERPYTRWANGEPNNAGNEDCAQVWARDGNWNDLPCDRRLGIICEDPCDPATDADGDGVSGCGSDCDDGDPTRAPGLPDVCNDGIDQDCNGEVDDGEGCLRCEDIAFGPHVYRACRDRMTYADAIAACEGMGMSLAILADAGEARRVADGARAASAREYWIGLDDRQAEGTFRWLDGREVAADAPWSAGEPNDYGAGEDCAHINAGNPLWNDRPCNATLGFICEASCAAGDADADGVPRCEGDCDDLDPAVGRCGP